MRHPSTEHLSDVRVAYLDGLAGLDEALRHQRVTERWEAPSALDGMTVSSLVGHVALSAFQVETFLDVTDPETHHVSAAQYYGRLVETDRPDSALNVGVMTRAGEVAALGRRPVVEAVSEAVARLNVRIPGEPAERTIGIAHRPGERMLLDEYLATRCVELSVHLDDLALTLSLDPLAPESTIRVANRVLVAAAEIRHGSRAVLVAMTRRERDDIQALRLL